MHTCLVCPGSEVWQHMFHCPVDDPHDKCACRANRPGTLTRCYSRSELPIGMPETIRDSTRLGHPPHPTHLAFTQPLPQAPGEVVFNHFPRAQDGRCRCRGVGVGGRRERRTQAVRPGRLVSPRRRSSPSRRRLRPAGMSVGDLSSFTATFPIFRSGVGSPARISRSVVIGVYDSNQGKQGDM